MNLLNSFRPPEKENDLTPKGHQLHPIIYKIIPPEITSGAVYHFTTDSGVNYEARFGRLRDSLGCVINFNVMNEEYDDDVYAVTNKGEIYRVVATVIKIMEIYIENNPLRRSFEFSGEFKKGNEHRVTSIRTEFFHRTIKTAFATGWVINLVGNKVTMRRM